MTGENREVFVYQLRVWLREISPAIWRRLLVRSDSTIADLHYALQIAMGWTDFHLHQFIIHGKRYGISRIYGISFADDPKKRYPVCTGGARSAPPEDCGGPWAFMELRQRYSFYNIAERMLEIVESEDLKECRWDYQEEVRELLYWLKSDKFPRRNVNRRLRQYALNDEQWLSYMEDC